MDLTDLRELLEYWEEHPPTHELMYAAWFKPKSKAKAPRTREQISAALGGSGATRSMKPRRRFNSVEASTAGKTPRQFNNPSSCQTS